MIVRESVRPAWNEIFAHSKKNHFQIQRESTFVSNGGIRHSVEFNLMHLYFPNANQTLAKLRLT
jgi:hypothetical protein